MDNLLLPAEYFYMLEKIFKENKLNCTVLAYGSRLSGDAHSGSDLDLALVQKTHESLNLAELREAITESNIPFFVDVCDFSRLPLSYQKEIEKNCIEIY